jgi:hypothetical protein
MARTEARIRCAVWRDRDFTSLPLESQGLYWMLLSQPDVSLAGVVPYNSLKWSHLCDGDVNEALEPLEVGGYVMPDPTTGELWIRTFAKHDGVLNGKKTRAGMWSAWHNILSPGIRFRFLQGLPEGCVDEAVEEGWVTAHDLERAVADFDAQASEDGVSGGVSAIGGNGVSPRARADSASDSASASDSDIGRRKPERPLPDDWKPTDAHRSLAVEVGVDLEVEEAQFRDHAKANDRRQRDWDAAFRTWLRNAKKFTKARASPRDNVSTFEEGTEEF